MDGTRKTPLFQEHVRLNGTMTEFAGWTMPLYYDGIVREVESVRRSVGIFDLSHMGELWVSGGAALDLLQHVTTNDVSALDIGAAQYTLMCDESGGIVDDLIIYRLDEHDYMVVVNAANTDSDRQWIVDHNPHDDRVDDRTLDTALVAVQGPAARDVLRPLVSFDIGSMERFGIRRGSVGDIEAWVAGTGYTGGPGYEIYCSAEDARTLWETLLNTGESAGIRPCGLGARDVLRIEAGYPLYGHELNRNINPAMAKLLWVVKPQKGEFIGREAILEAAKRGPERVLVGLEAGKRCVPREGYDVLSSNGQKIGRLTSGTFSPTLGKGIGMAYIQARWAEIGTQVNVVIRDRQCPFTVVKMPFYPALPGLFMNAGHS